MFWFALFIINSSSQYGSTTLSAEFGPSQPLPSIFYPGQRSSNLALLTLYCAGDKMEKNEMGWACGTYG